MKDDFKNAALNPGSLLVFVSDVDPTFWTKVVLLLEHDQRGSKGIIINRVDTDYDYKQVARQQKVDPLKAQSEENRVFLDGGPAGDVNLTVIYEGKDGRIAHAGNDSKDQFKISKELETSGARAVRLAVNYAGWSPGQLKAEIGAGAWRVIPADNDLVFRTPFEEIFPKAAAKAGLHPDFIRYLTDTEALRQEKGGFEKTQEYVRTIWPKVPAA